MRINKFFQNYYSFKMNIDISKDLKGLYCLDIYIKIYITKINLIQIKNENGKFSIMSKILANRNF